MTKLITINGMNDAELLSGILSNDIIVYEDIQGSKIWVNWNGEEISIKPKNLSNDSLNLVDLAIQNYYNPAIEFFSSLDNRVKKLLKRDWWYCFEYFPDNQPANIQYDKVPKNNLILTSINKKGKYNFDIDELEEYARLFNVDSIPIIFKGKLTEPMKEAIKYFINTSEKDLKYVFGEKSFAYFFYKVLNPSSTNSFLMDDEFQENIEKLIIKSEDENISFELLNPLYSRLSSNNNTEYVEIYTLLLLNFLNFLQGVDLYGIKIVGKNKDECYLDLISKLFNLYMNEVKEDLINFDFIIPSFFDKDKFKINKEMITNKVTKLYIDESPKLEYFFKIFLGSFNKKKKKTIGLFNTKNLELFNKIVDEIDSVISVKLNIKHENDLKKSGLMDFNDFFKINYDKDGEGNVYPDIYNEFGETSDDKKKKKGKNDFKGKIK